MGTKEKRIKRLKSIPKDYTFDELCVLLDSLGFVLSSKGKTSGSTVKFTRDHIVIKLHKPHLRKELLRYQIQDVLWILERDNLI